MMHRDRRNYTKIFEYSFLQAGLDYEFQVDATQEILRGTLTEMFVHRDDEDDVWVSFYVHGEAMNFDYPIDALTFEGDDDNEEDVAYPVKFVKLVDYAKLPVYSTPGSSGMDFFSVTAKYILPGEMAMIDTGLKIELPPGFELQLRSRSSMGKAGVIIGNGVGTVDNDYRGPITFCFWNVSKQTYIVNVGDKIGQGVLAPVFQGTPLFVEELSETVRGEGGFGSTGK